MWFLKKIILINLHTTDPEERSGRGVNTNYLHKAKKILKEEETLLQTLQTSKT